MSERVDTFERLLDDQVSVSERLLAVMERERRATVELDLDGLRDALFEKETLLGALAAMEEALVRFLRTEAVANGSTETAATVTDLIERMRPSVGEATTLRLIARRDRVRALHRQIRELGEQERMLVEHSLRTVQLSLKIIRNRIEPDAFYSSAGRARPAQERCLFSRGA